VGLAARVIEKSGIATVTLCQMPFVIEKIKPPRAVAIEFPFSMIWGHPGDRETQLRILRDMLEAARTMQTPGTVIELPYTWPEEDLKKRDWFPTEPPPWMTDQEKINEMLAFIQGGDPLEEV
jgi:hypothetical protein